MKNKTLYLAGMFRSGTTLVARMLASHRSIACASDPYLPLYKEIRNRVNRSKSKSNIINNEEGPLQDYYFDDKSIDTYEGVKDFVLAAEYISREELAAIKQKIYDYSKPYSGRLARNVDKLEGDTFQDLINNAKKLVKEIYGDVDTDIVATKEVWANEFCSTLLRSKVVHKVIHMVRDPRAVVASNIASGQVYPLLFTLRQWRKIAGIAIMNEDTVNQKILRYEDLVKDKKKVSIDLCQYLEIDYDESMVCEEKYEDGDGKPWERNTSYKNKEVNKIKGSDDWKDILSDQQVMYIEKYAGKEMELLGYNKNLSNYPSIIGYEEKGKVYANWIRTYSSYNWEKEEEKEINRLELIKNVQEISQRQIEYNFIDREIYNALRSN